MVLQDVPSVSPPLFFRPPSALPRSTPLYSLQFPSPPPCPSSRWGTAQFAFSADNADEASVSVGERVKVLTEMGDWMHVLTSSGARLVGGS